MKKGENASRIEKVFYIKNPNAFAWDFSIITGRERVSVLFEQLDENGGVGGGEREYLDPEQGIRPQETLRECALFLHRHGNNGIEYVCTPCKKQ